MNAFVCDGTCAGNDLGDCSHSIEAGEKSELAALRAELAAEREKTAILVAAFQRARKHSLKHETFTLIEDALDAITAVKP